MTLILSAISRDVIVMASDRTLTDSNTGRPSEEKHNKLVVVEDRFAFGYSGLAEIERQKTDLWLARGLRTSPDLKLALEAIGRRATSVFARMPSWIPKRQAFLGVGWADVDGGELRPMWICVSNCWNESLGGWLPDVRAEFSLTAPVLLPPRQRWLLCPGIGASLTSRELEHARDLVGAALRRHPHTVAAAQLLGSVIRAVAERNGSVGKEVTCVVLPRPSKKTKERGYRLLTPRARVAGRFREPVAFDLDDRGRIKWHPPVIVCPGVAIVVPELALGPGEGDLSYTLHIHEGGGGIPRGHWIGLGVGDGKKQVLLALGEKAQVSVEEGPWEADSSEDDKP